MKIGIDIRCLMDDRYSGVSWYAYNLLRSIFEIDRDNRYILFYNSGRPVALPEFDYDNVEYRGFHYPNKLFNLVINFFNFPEVDRLIGGVDIFFVPNLHFIAWSRNCRKIITVHDLSFLLFPEFFTLRMRLWHKLILKRNILGQADSIIADSFSTKGDLIRLLGLPEKKISVIHLGVDRRYFEPCGEEKLAAVRQKYSLPEKFILSLGTIEPRKNLAGVIAAYNLAESDASLVIAGGKGWKSKTADIESKKIIRWLGYVKEEDKPAIYQLANSLVYPSFYEGFGLPLLEAMACGCPVIAGANSSQPEVVGTAGLLVDPHNASEIARSIDALASDSILSQKMRDSGRLQAAKFSWENAARQIIDLFNNNRIYENRN